MSDISYTTGQPFVDHKAGVAFPHLTQFFFDATIGAVVDNGRLCDTSARVLSNLTTIQDLENYAGGQCKIYVSYLAITSLKKRLVLPLDEYMTGLGQELFLKIQKEMEGPERPFIDYELRVALPPDAEILPYRVALLGDPCLSGPIAFVKGGWLVGEEIQNGQRCTVPVTITDLMEDHDSKGYCVRWTDWTSGRKTALADLHGYVAEGGQGRKLFDILQEGQAEAQPAQPAAVSPDSPTDDGPIDCRRNFVSAAHRLFGVTEKKGPRISMRKLRGNKERKKPQAG